VLVDCLKSLDEESRHEPLEIIVFDNASTDRTVELIRRDFPEVRLIESKDNVGFAKGNNEALDHASGSYVMFLNPDTIVHPGCIQTLKSFMDENPLTAIAGPKILQPDGRVQVVCARQFPSLLMSIFELSLLRRIFPRSRLFGRYRMEYWDHESGRKVPCILGAAMLVRRDFLDKHGYMDERIPMYYEDVELCKRAWCAGYDVQYLPEAEIDHLVAQSAAVSKQRLALFVLEQGEAYWLYFSDFRGRGTALCFSAIMLVGSLFRILVLLPVLVLGFIMPEGVRQKAHVAHAKYMALLRWSVLSKDPEKVLKRFPLN